MAFSVDKYLGARFDLKRWNCWDHVRAAWLDITGRDLGARTPVLLSHEALCERFESDLPAFQKISDPVSPCLVLMKAPGVVPHVGLFYKGRVLQITKAGASYLPLHSATAGFLVVEFYRDQDRNRIEPV